MRRGWIAIVAVLLVGAWATYAALREMHELDVSPDGGAWLLPLLSFALIVLSLALAGVLIRNIVKLIVERKRGILGATLRSKLVFFFLALVLAPAIVLFSGSAQVIKRTVEAILRAPLEQLTGGRRVADDWMDHFRERATIDVRTIAELVDRGAAPPLGAAEVERLRDAASLELLRVERVGGPRVEAVHSGADLPVELLDALADEAREAPVIRVETGRRGLVIYAAHPLAGEPGGTVSIASRVPPRIAESLSALDAADRAYRQFRSHRRELVRYYVSLIGLIFLATLFVATWLGFYTSRRITEPLRALAAASREISAGNLDVRVETRIGDEMGTLVDSFNEMAAQLQESRAVITRSTAELRRSNRELDGRRRYIETLLAGLSTGVVSLDTAGLVTAVNPAAETILGVRLAPGDDPRPALAQRGLDALIPLLDETSEASGRTLRRDLDLVVDEGTLSLSVQVSTLHDGSGTELGTLLMVEDLSDLLRAQRALAWQEVARRIAHEIKNPLTPIQLAAQRLRKKFRGGASDIDQVVTESTAAIEREVGGLKQLVDEFSRFARMPELRLEPVELAQVVESVHSLYRGSHGIEWSVEIDPRVGLVRVDPQQLRRALINLADNAIAALGGRGSIWLTARAVGGRLLLEFADDGPGIPAADRDKMFVPYFSTKPRGSGLGLAIVHKIVTDHGGTIRAEDNSPRGARFVIEMPVIDAARASG